IGQLCRNRDKESTSLKTSKGNVPTDGLPLGPTWAPRSSRADVWRCRLAWCFLNASLRGLVQQKVGISVWAQMVSFLPSIRQQTQNTHLFSVRGDQRSLRLVELSAGYIVAEGIDFEYCIWRLLALD
ncbi:MAG: hypothetical protein ACKPKO_61945, partial [Candidatus Fonsibacter sp.]